MVTSGRTRPTLSTLSGFPTQVTTPQNQGLDDAPGNSREQKQAATAVDERHDGVVDRSESTVEEVQHGTLDDDDAEQVDGQVHLRL